MLDAKGFPLSQQMGKIEFQDWPKPIHILSPKPKICPKCGTEVK